MTDMNNPFCAFNATGFTLNIVNRYGVTLYSTQSINNDCCPFVSPGPGNNIAHSDIWWNGYTNNIFGNMVHPVDGTYYYYVTLYGCNGEEIELHGPIKLRNNGYNYSSSRNTERCF